MYKNKNLIHEMHRQWRQCLNKSYSDVEDEQFNFKLNLRAKEHLRYACTIKIYGIVCLLKCMDLI